MAGPAATQLVAIDEYLIDCSLNETHTFESDVTNYPVESGSNITDNVRPLPVVIEMECIVTNTPLGDHRGAQLTGTPEIIAYDLLQGIRTDRKPVTIRTSLRTFDNMVLKNLTIPRSSGRGDELRFTATWQQIQVVTNKRTIRVSIPIAKGSGSGKKKLTLSPGVDTTRLIAVDTIKRLWFDPDAGLQGLWRKGVKFERITVRLGTDGTTYRYEDQSVWVLSRGSTSSVLGHSATGETLFPWIPTGATSGGRPGTFPPLVMLYPTQYVLDGDFTIYKTHSPFQGDAFRPR